MAHGIEHAGSSSKTFKCIELLLQWKGSLKTNDLTQYLGISRQTASKAINKYREQHPNTLSYCPSAKVFTPTVSFSASSNASSFQEYLSLFHQKSITSLSSSFNSNNRQPSPAIVRPILNAIENNLRLDIAYASISSPAFEERIISPHSLIDDGNRWHVRAWCEKNRDYRDFVLNRIRKVFDSEGCSEAGRSSDDAWNTWVNLSITPDPRLTEGQQNIVAMDYGMERTDDGVLKATYRVRGALVIYWLQKLRLDWYSNRPEEQQIVLCKSSQAEVKSWVR